MILEALFLSIMEISLSFDNAILNASVLKRMSKRLQELFLTVGFLTSVVAVRLVLPALIVAVSAGLPFMEVVKLATEKPELYAYFVTKAHDTIATFGGVFLFLVFCDFLDEDQHHWLPVEKHHRALQERSILFNVPVALGGILVALLGVPIVPMLIACMTWLFIKGLEAVVSRIKAYAGVAAFIYLEILDASFSLDGVVAAFAITTDIWVIMFGLGIGSLAIRMITVHLVRKGTLEELPYLAHGAMWSIGTLAVLMLISTRVHVPEMLTGGMAVVIIGTAVVSSLNRRKL